MSQKGGHGTSRSHNKRIIQIKSALPSLKFLLSYVKPFRFYVFHKLQLIKIVERLSMSQKERLSPIAFGVEDSKIFNSKQKV